MPGTTFNHDLAAFKLTGRHKTVECQACHKTNTFKGTAQDCVSCHAEPKQHKGRYGTACANCHTTATWEGATFQHKFPLNHGKRNRTIECSVCHTEDKNFKTYTCYGCHEHEEKRMARKHKNVKNLADCARCHPTGREKERGAASSTCRGPTCVSAAPAGATSWQCSTRSRRRAARARAASCSAALGGRVAGTSCSTG